MARPPPLLSPPYLVAGEYRNWNKQNCEFKHGKRNYHNTWFPRKGTPTPPPPTPPPTPSPSPPPPHPPRPPPRTHAPTPKHCHHGDGIVQAYLLLERNII